MDTPKGKIFTTPGGISYILITFGLLGAGGGLAIFEIWDQPSQAGVSFVLLGIAFLLFRLIDCVEEILRGVTSLQKLKIEQKEK